MQLLLTALIFLFPFSSSANWEGNVLCHELKTLLTLEKPFAFFQKKIYERPIILGGEVSAGNGPAEYFLKGIDGGEARKYVHAGRGSDSILGELLKSSSELEKASVLLALDLLYEDAKHLASNCTEDAVRSFYKKGPLPKILELKKPVILGRIPLYNGDVNHILTAEHKCAVVIDAVVNTEICRPNKASCLWLDLEDFYVMKLKDKAFFPKGPFAPSQKGAQAMGQEICRLLSENFQFQLRKH